MPIYKFSPNLASPEERQQTFVAREAVLEDLLDRVRKIESGARHCVLIGPRGIGKTHLLLLLKDTIAGDESLASQWEVIRFSEEEYSVTSLAELFLRVVEMLPGGKPENMGRDVDLALGHVLDFSAASGKRLLLLMDNIHLYFSQFPDTDIGRLRDVLMSKSAFLIVGAAPSYFKQMTGYEESFYNFFEPIHLNELVPDEVERMLQRRAEFEGNEDVLAKLGKCHQEIRTITRLTGGNPRLILMLYQVMCESHVMKAAEAFKELLDELTPYFQERMGGLPPQGRKVLDTLAFMEGPSTPTELAEEAGMQVNAVTSQLKRLRDVGYVQQVKRQRSKTTRYEVTERLFRMWREMRTETGRTRLRFIIRFLELWYTPAQLMDETVKLLTQLAQAQRTEKPRFLSHLQYLKEATPELLQPEMERVCSNAEAGRLELAAAEIPSLKELASYDEDVRSDPDNVEAWSNRSKALSCLGRYQEALESVNKAIQIQPDYAEAWRIRGVALGSLDKYQEALESVNKAIQIQPDNAMAWRNHGAVLSSLEKHEEALESYDKAIQIQPDGVQTWLSRGLVLDDLERYEEALESYDEAIELQPNDAHIRFHRGLALGNLERYEEALESYDRAIQIQSGYTVAWGNRGVTLVRLGRYKEALESCDKAIQIQPDDVIAWLNRGAALGNLERYEEALESYDKAIQIQPDNATAWLNRGGALFNLERYEEALESCDKAIQIQPDNVPAWLNRASTLSKLERHEEALESYDKVIQIQPDNATAWLNRGGALFNLERYEEALESCDKAIQIQPDNVPAWLNRASTLSKLERHEEALESYDKAIQIQPEDANAWYNRGQTLIGLGRYGEALESFDRAIQLQPEHEGSWCKRGLALHNLGRYEEALQSFDRAVTQLQKACIPIWHYRGETLHELGRREEELESYDRAIQIQPADAIAWCDRGDTLLYNLKQYAEALESYDNAIQIQPDDAMSWNNRGVALVNLGRNDEALESLKRAAELANAQNLENVSEFASLLAAETELLGSLESLREDNLGSARRSLKNAIDNGKQADSDDFQLVLFGYLKESLKSGRIQFVQEAIEMIVSEFGEEYEKLLSPFINALEYMQTEDESILERLHQEVRELVLDIVEYSRGKEE